MVRRSARVSKYMIKLWGEINSSQVDIGKFNKPWIEIPSFGTQKLAKIHKIEIS